MKETKNTTENDSAIQDPGNLYSVVIDIFRKGSYKTYSYRMVNNHFEAIKFQVNKEHEIIVSKRLSYDEAKEFEKFINSFPIETLEDSYINKGVKGSYHLNYQITIGKVSKSIYVYFKQQDDLVELYKRLSEFIPEDDKFLYYGN